MFLMKNNYHCPVRLPTERGSDVVGENGIAYISEDFYEPYDNFTNWCFYNSGMAPGGGAVSIVANIDTGEVRYYDGSQGIGVNSDSSIYFSIPQLSLCKVIDFSLSKSMRVTEIDELGQIYPDSIDEYMYNAVEINLDKVYVDKVKLESTVTDINSPLLNQFGFSGMTLLELDEFVQTLKQNYYVAILYIPDMNPSANHVATSHIIPCAKFSNVSIDVANNNIISASISGKATYMRTLPRRLTSTYNPFVSFEPAITCELNIENWDWDPFPASVGKVVGADYDYRSVGQTITMVEDINLCKIGIELLDTYAITEGHGDLKIELWTDRPTEGGAAYITESDVVRWEDLNQDSETQFTFPSQPALGNGLQYFFCLIQDSVPTEHHEVKCELPPMEAGSHYIGGSAYYAMADNWNHLPATPDEGWGPLIRHDHKDMWFRVYKVL